MRAIVVNQPGGVDQLMVTKQPIPIPKAGELLIKVKASAVNRTDIVSREKGLGYMSNPILGVEVAGIVEEVGAGVEFAVGTRVMGLVNGGGYAEYVIMPANRAMVIPECFTFEEAAAIPEVFLTAYQTLFWIGQLQKGETVLIHAGGSGVGTAAIQLAKKYGKAKVITTAGSKHKLDFCRSLGADVCVNYKEQNFTEEVMKFTHNRGVDLILDFVGASYWNQNFSSIKIDGRWVLIGVLGGVKVENINIMKIMSRRIQLTGTLLTPRSDEYKAALTADFSDEILSYFTDYKIRPIIDRVYSLDEIRLAHERMENNENIGKIILRVGL